MSRLQRCPLWFVQHLIKSKWYEKELYRVDALCSIDGAERWHLNDISKANPGHMTFPVGGAKFANQHLSGGGFVEGRKFYRFVQMRGAADNNNTRRAMPPPLCEKCHSGEPATLQHILCSCEDNLNSIRERHDTVLKQIVAHCRRSNLVVIVEPTLSCGLRPDLVVLLPSGETLCLDITVVFELNKDSLNKANRLKQVKYQPHLAEIHQLMSNELRSHPGNLVQRSSLVTAYGLAFGCRGNISATALNVLKSRLAVPIWRINKMINLIISSSLDLFVHSLHALTL